MPVSRGIMMMNRLNVRSTTTEFQKFESDMGDGLEPFIPPGPAPCNGVVVCTVKVIALPKAGLPNVRPTGTVTLLDTIRGTTIGTESLTNGIANNESICEFSVEESVGNYSLLAIYNGVSTAFSISRSLNVPISFTKNTCNIVFEGDGYENACPDISSVIGAYFTSLGDPITEGFVQFRFYNSDTPRDGYISAGPYDLEETGDGYMGFEILPEYLEFDRLYGVQALYLGSNCISPADTAPGVTASALKISTSGHDTTTISAVSAIGSTTFCRRQSKQFSCQVSADEFTDPSAGAVTFYCAPSPANTPLVLIATDNNLVDGYALATVPADMFPSVGNYYVYAKYNGRGTCYANSDSLSAPLSVITTQNNVSATNDMEGFKTDGFALFNMHLSSAISGTISGRVTLAPISGITGPTIGPIVCSGPHTGFDVPVPIPANTYSPGSGVFRFTFISDGAGCYGDSTTSSGTIVLT